MRVGDYDAGSVVGLRLEESFKSVLVLGTHGYAGHVDVPVSHGHETEILLRPRLPAGCKLRNSGARGSFGGLSASIRIHLGIEHQQVHVSAAGQDVIETAIADVIRPAVAAYDPDTLLNEHVGDREQLPRFNGVVALQLVLEYFNSLPLFEDVGLVLLR